MEGLFENHLRRLALAARERLKHPENYFFKGPEQVLTVNENRIRLGRDTSRQIRKMNFDYGMGSGRMGMVGMTYVRVSPAQYCCYAPPKLWMVDDSGFSLDDFRVLTDLHSATEMGEITGDNRLNLPRMLKGSKKVGIKLENEFFTLEGVE